MAAFSDLFARLDPDPRIRGKQFEYVCKWFLTNDPLYKQRLRHVWLWKEWPDRPSDTEAGIDLVAEDADGHLFSPYHAGIQEIDSRGSHRLFSH